MARGSRVNLGLLVEVTPGVTPAGTPIGIRKTGDSLKDSRGVVESGEIRSDREDASDIDGNLNVAGDLNCELLWNGYTELWESALAQQWTDNDTGIITSDVTTGPSTFDRSSGDFVADGFEVGQWIRTEGYTDPANNGWFKLTIVATTLLTIAPPTVPLVAESGGGDERISNSVLDGGTTNQFLSIVKRFEDIAEEVVLAGCLVNQVSITLDPEAVVPIVFAMNGRSVTGPQALGTAPVNPSTSNPMASFSGEVFLDNVVNANITNLQYQLANNIADGFAIGSQTKVDQFEGRRKSSGTVSFYFNDLTEYTTTQSHTARDLGFSLAEAGEYIGITLPRTYIDFTIPEVPDEGPLTLEGPFRSKLDSTLGHSVIISASIV